MFGSILNWLQPLDGIPWELPKSTYPEGPYHEILKTITSGTPSQPTKVTVKGGGDSGNSGSIDVPRYLPNLPPLATKDTGISWQALPSVQPKPDLAIPEKYDPWRWVVPITYPNDTGGGGGSGGGGSETTITPWYTYIPNTTTNMPSPATSTGGKGIWTAPWGTGGYGDVYGKINTGNGWYDPNAGFQPLYPGGNNDPIFGPIDTGGYSDGGGYV